MHSRATGETDSEVAAGDAEMRAEFAEGEAELAGMREQRRGESVHVLVDLHLLPVASTTSTAGQSEAAFHRLAGHCCYREKIAGSAGALPRWSQQKKRHMWCCAPLRQ